MDALFLWLEPIEVINMQCYNASDLSTGGSARSHPGVPIR